MLAGEAALVAVAVDRDVVLVALAELLAGFLDDLQPAFGAHRLGADVGVGTRAVPVAGDRFRIERHRKTVILAQAGEEPAGDPELVADRERSERADLVFPLAKEYFGVSAFAGQAGLETGLEVLFDQRTRGDVIGTDAAVVVPLGTWVYGRLLGPAGDAALVQERVLLLDAEPRLLGLVGFGERAELGAGVAGMRRRSVGQHDFAHHEDVRLAADRIGVERDRLEGAIALVARGLSGTGSVEAPVGDVGERLHAAVEDFPLGTQAGGRRAAVQPKVFGDRFHLFPPVTECVTADEKSTESAMMERMFTRLNAIVPEVMKTNVVRPDTKLHRLENGVAVFACRSSAAMFALRRTEGALLETLRREHPGTRIDRVRFIIMPFKP